MYMYSKRARNTKEKNAYYMFGLHAVKAAIKNPNRKIHELWISQNAKDKIFFHLLIDKLENSNL